jgi:cytochrome c oxidase subunit III
MTTRSSRLLATKDRPVPGAAPFGLALFLVSLSVLFVAGLVAYAVVRARAPSWPPAGTAPLPWTLWLSTALLVVSSGTIHLALRGARAGAQGQVRAGLALTSLLAVGFLVGQGVSWNIMAAGRILPTRDLYGFTFFVLTALHAVHVIGGAIPLAVATWRGWRGAYGPDEHEGVKLVSMYWHFLDVVWLVLFGTLVVFGGTPTG